jgi:LAO/AO transport system kinase
VPLNDVDELVQRLLAGDRRALSRAISEVENASPLGLRALQILYPHTGNAQSIGITGSAGAGKSTLTRLLARAYRASGATVGVVAVDPSSPFSQGAILGDRIRMQDLTSDPGVFVRSMATRGSVGGLAAMAADVAAVLDAAGRDVILIETVGAGQDEVEIAGVARTTLLVNTPGMGDDIQAIKAGIIEVADILVVNKADLPGADAVVAQLQTLLSLAPQEDWQTPVIKLSAKTEEGVDQLLNAIDSHRQYLESSQSGVQAGVERARHQIVAAAQAELARRLRAPNAKADLDALTQRVVSRGLDPRSAALELLHRLSR